MIVPIQHGSPVAGTWLAWLRMLRPAKARAPRLDVESLPDYLRRDLGLSHGRSGPRRDPMLD